MLVYLGVCIKVLTVALILSSRPWHVKKMPASNLGLGSGFRRVLRFPSPCNIAEKVTKIEIPNSILSIMDFPLLLRLNP